MVSFTNFQGYVRSLLLEEREETKKSERTFIDDILHYFVTEPVFLPALRWAEVSPCG